MFIISPNWIFIFYYPMPLKTFVNKSLTNLTSLVLGTILDCRRTRHAHQVCEILCILWTAQVGPTGLSGSHSPGSVDSEYYCCCCFKTLLNFRSVCWQIWSCVEHKYSIPPLFWICLRIKIVPTLITFFSILSFQPNVWSQIQTWHY